MSIRSIPTLLRRTHLLGILAACLFPIVFSQLSAAAAAKDSALAQGYQADNSNGKIVTGTLVSYKPGSSGAVELATNATADRLVGIAGHNPVIAISNGQNHVQIVLSGTTLALVSDINGAVKSGDKIAPSPIAGVGMKATTDGQIIGTAQGAVTPTKTISITDKSRKGHTVHIGYVTIQVGSTYYQAPGSTFLPPFMQNIANSLAGRQVSLMRVMVAALVVMLGFVSVIMLVYSGVRSSMQSIGRNPLAAPDIRRGLYQIILIAVAVTGSTALVGYLILRV